MRKGYFISFESIDGVGKSTQLFELGKALKDAGHDIFYTKEPGDKKYGSIVGAGVREILFFTAKTQNLAPGVADLLFLADHLQAQADVKKALSQGKVVLADRFADSQFAYAASAAKKCPQWALDLYAKHYTVVPDMTVLMVARGPGLDHETADRGRAAFEDISWALARGKARKGDEAGKQDGKAWNDVEEQRKIQNAYLLNLANQKRTFMVHVWPDLTIGDLHQTILVEALRRIVNKTMPNEVEPYLPFTGESKADIVSRA